MDWEKGILITAGTQTISKYLHRHVLYVFDVSNPAEIALRTSSEIWETNEPQFQDVVSHVFLDQVDGIWHIVAFTSHTSSAVVFRFDDQFNEVTISSFPQRLNKGHINDVRQGFGYYWVSFNSQDLVRLRIHSPK